MESSLLAIIHPFISLRMFPTQVLALHFFFNLKEKNKDYRIKNSNQNSQMDKSLSCRTLISQCQKDLQLPHSVSVH